MTLIRAVGFEFNTLLELDAINGTVAISSTQARSGSYSFRPNYSAWNGNDMANNGQISFTAGAELYFQFAYYPITIPYASAGGTFFQWRKAGTALGSIELQQDSTVKVYTGNRVDSSGGTLVGTSTATVPNNSWTLLELHIKIANDPDGIIELRINGSSQFIFTGDSQPGADTTFDNISMGGYRNPVGSTQYTYFEDIVVNNTSDATSGVNPNNSWPNGRKIALLKPTGAGTYTEWTAVPATTDWDRVNELPPSMADYITAGSNGLRDTFVIEDCPAGMGPIAAVIPTYWGQVSGSPACANVKTLLRSGVTDNAGSNIALPNSYGRVRQILELSPFTSILWTTAEINAMEFGPQSAT